MRTIKRHYRIRVSDMFMMWSETWRLGSPYCLTSHVRDFWIRVARRLYIEGKR